MKKIFVVMMTLMISSSFILSACSSNNGKEASESDKGKGAAEVKVIRFLHNETDPPSVEFFNKAIKEFEAANPGIKVQMEAVSTDARLQKLTAAFASKTAPEVFKILAEERFNFARKGNIESLDDLVSSIGQSDFIPGIVTKIDGKVYDLPYTLGNWGVLWYRDDLLKAKGIKPPTNWEELKAAAKALTEDINGDGKPDKFGIVIPAGKNRMTSLWFSQLLWSAGGTYFDKDMNVSFDSPATVKSLQMIKDLKPYAPPGMSSYSYGEVADVYLSGNVAMNIYAGRLVSRASTNAPDLLKVTKAAPMPVGPAGSGVKLVSPNSFAISSSKVGAKNQAEAKKFLQFLITGERSQNFSLTAFPHLIPPLKSVQDKMLKSELPKNFEGRKDLMDAAFDTSNGTDFPTEAGLIVKDGSIQSIGKSNPYIGSIIDRHIPAMVVQKVLIENVSPEEATKWGAEEMKKIVADLNK